MSAGENVPLAMAKWAQWLSEEMTSKLEESIAAEQCDIIKLVDGRVVYEVNPDAEPIDEDEWVGISMSVSEWRLTALNARKVAAYLTLVADLEHSKASA